MKNKYQNIPAVHRKVKKKDMIFEYILIGILILFLVYIIIDVCNLIPKLTNKIELTSVAGTVVAVYALIWQLHSAIKGNKVLATLDLSASVDGNYVTLSCSITNVGTKSIYPYLTNLYINEGKELNSDGSPCRFFLKQLQNIK